MPANTRTSWIPQPFGPQWLKNWLERHQDPTSFVLHMIGIPMTLLLPLCWFYGEWVLGLACFVFGYGLQFLGHAIEGNDAGELILIKRLFGWPYVAVAPQWQTTSAS